MVALVKQSNANTYVFSQLWLCQRSLMAVGGPWYGFGWEPQLAELSFHTLFLVPFLSLNPLPKMSVPVAVQWTIRWMLFRIMMGAGLIKLRSGDQKWKDLTTMNYFYETQPVPNPLTRYLHWMPKWWHKGEVLSNHFVELVAPWLLILPCLPRSWRLFGGVTQIVFQLVLIMSGNLSFLNWLTIVPAIMCLDDAFLSRAFSPAYNQIAFQRAMTNQPSYLQHAISLTFLALILRLSVPVVRNLLSKRQVMNSSYDPLRLVNTYGAFGTVNENRHELIVSAASSWDGEWREYNFKVKPGDIHRSPKFISPYHYRLDWLMWIAANMQSFDRCPWMYRFLRKLLQQDQQVMDLLESDPWEDSLEKPKYIKVDVYSYQFHRKQHGEEEPPYWDREFMRRVYPEKGLASIDDLEEKIKDLSRR